MRVHEPELKPHDRVFRRPESSVWQFYVTTPPHLLHHFDGKPFAFRRSLGTRDLAEANRRAKLIDAEWVQRCRQLEAQDNPQRAPLTPELVAAIAAGVRRWVALAGASFGSVAAARAIG